jgi:hypothetical protein
MKSSLKKMLILVIVYLGVRNEGEVDFFKTSNLFKNNFSQLTEKQQQCVVLRKYLNAIPVDDVYKESSFAFLTDLFKRDKAEKKLKTFQSMYLLILTEVSKINHSQSDFDAAKLDTLVTSLKQDNYQELTDLLNSFQTNSASQVLNTEEQKMQFLSKALLILKSLFIKSYIKDTQQDAHITEVKTATNKLFNTKKNEVKQSYVAFKNEVKKLNDEKTKIDKKITEYKKKITDDAASNSKPPQQQLDEYKKVKDLEKKLEKIPEAVEISDGGDYFDTLIEDGEKLSLNDNELKNLVKEIKVLIKKMNDAKDEQKAEIINVRYYELIHGLDFETSKKKTEDDTQYHDFKKDTKYYLFYQNYLEEKIKAYNTKKKEFKDKFTLKIKETFLERYDNQLKLNTFMTDYMAFIKNAKKIKFDIKQKQKDLNKKILELNDIDFTLKLLNIKLDSEMMIPQTFYLDLLTEIGQAKNKMDYTKSSTDEELKESEKQGRINYEATKKRLQESIQNKDGNEEALKVTVKVQENFLSLQILAVKVNALEKVLKILTYINDITEMIDMKTAKLFARLQNMDNGERCLTLPKLSYAFFRMMKTNMIYYEKIFLDTFLTNLKDFGQQKRFIMYNYMISDNRKYSVKEFKILNENRTSEKEKQFVNNFCTNYVLFVSIMRDTTLFSRESSNKEDTKSKIKNMLKPSNLIKKVFAMVKLPVIIGTGLLDKTVFDLVFDNVTKLLLIIFPFLNLIPFIHIFIKVLKMGLLFAFKSIMTKMFKNGLNSFDAKLSSSQLGRSAAEISDELNIYKFEYNEIFNDEAFIKGLDLDLELQGDINLDKVAEIEGKYKAIMSDNNFDFETFDALDNFDYSTDLMIDIDKLEDENYLKDIHVVSQRRLI